MNKMQQFADNLTDFNLDNDNEQQESKIKSVPISIHENKFTFELNQNLKITDKGLSKINESYTEDEVQFNQVKLEDLQMLEVLGCGSSGKVEKVLHIQTNNHLALKQIQFSDNQQFQKHLKIELETLIKSDHKNLIKCFNVFYKQDESIAILLEYMDKGNLIQIQQKINKIPEVIIGIISIQILRGLEYLHKSLKVIHRDIKPQNILIDQNGVVKIADFGVSGKMEHTTDWKNTWAGTMVYMAPERILGQKYQADSDLWSLGLTLYQCATGKFPFQDCLKDQNRTFWELYTIIKEKQVPLLPEQQFSPKFIEFISTLLQKEQGNRSTSTELLKHPFIVQYEKADINKFAKWLKLINL